MIKVALFAVGGLIAFVIGSVILIDTDMPGYGIFLPLIITLSAIVVPLVQQMLRVNLRTIVMDVPSQDVISRDNVSAKVNAVLCFICRR